MNGEIVYQNMLLDPQFQQSEVTMEYEYKHSMRLFFFWWAFDIIQVISFDSCEVLNIWLLNSLNKKKKHEMMP